MECPRGPNVLAEGTAIIPRILLTSLLLKAEQPQMCGSLYICILSFNGGYFHEQVTI
jgi:hypothetical protein